MTKKDILLKVKYILDNNQIKVHTYNGKTEIYKNTQMGWKLAISIDESETEIVIDGVKYVI